MDAEGIPLQDLIKKQNKKKTSTANSRAEDGASRSAVRPRRVFRSGVRPGEQTTGAPGMNRRRGKAVVFYASNEN